jgi:hypothetical protein
MLSPDKVLDRSGHETGSGHPIGFRCAVRRVPWARMAVLGLALCVSSGAMGCGGGGGPESPEQKKKQEVVQDKMKGFMKNAKLPNRPG